ncbi:hypothetical protein Fmac_015520 [Flemingia macrophylla]|uniref:Uncharacterized protein n=1 Tax=Flemingia macrophylla TaxID=520843 RepID=A0ABD1MFD7_9FABA
MALDVVLPGGLDPPKLDEVHADEGGGVGDELGSVTFPLGTDNGDVTLGLYDDELGAFGPLLGDLFLLDGARELVTVGEVDDSNVIKDDIEVLGTMDKAVADEGRELGVVGEELVDVELGHDGLKDLIVDRADDLLVVLQAEILNDDEELLSVGAGKDVDGQVHHLEVIRVGDGGKHVGVHDAMRTVHHPVSLSFTLLFNAALCAFFRRLLLGFVFAFRGNFNFDCRWQKTCRKFQTLSSEHCLRRSIMQELGDCFEAGGSNVPSNISPWTIIGDDSNILVSTDRSSCFERNKIAVHLDVFCVGPKYCPHEGVGISNLGYWGVNIEKAQKYRVIFYVKAQGARDLHVSIVGSENGEKKTLRRSYFKVDKDGDYIGKQCYKL